jgi:hypothetical protein
MKNYVAAIAAVFAVVCFPALSGVIITFLIGIAIGIIGGAIGSIYAIHFSFRRAAKALVDYGILDKFADYLITAVIGRSPSKIPNLSDPGWQDFVPRSPSESVPVPVSPVSSPASPIPASPAAPIVVSSPVHIVSSPVAVSSALPIPAITLVCRACGKYVLDPELYTSSMTGKVYHRCCYATLPDDGEDGEFFRSIFSPSLVAPVWHDVDMDSLRTKLDNVFNTPQKTALFTVARDNISNRLCDCIRCARVLRLLNEQIQSRAKWLETLKG